MRPVERRLFKVNDEIQRLRREEELAQGELGFHRHLSDDATRDAVVTGLPADRAEARGATKDVARLEAALQNVRRRIQALDGKRSRRRSRLAWSEEASGRRPPGASHLHRLPNRD